MKIRKLICFIIVLVFIAVPFANASSLTEEKSHQIDTIFSKNEISRLSEVIEDKKLEIFLMTDEEFKSEISAIKVVKDFAENHYILIEFNPIGYMLYNVATSRFNEYSPINLSPFCGYNENLYYLGIGQYYFKNGDTYIHTLDNESQIKQNELADSNFVDDSQKLQEYYNQKPDTATLEYVNDGNRENYQIAKEESLNTAFKLHAEKRDFFETQGSVIKPWFSRRAWLSGLKQCGYISGGKCGFIALAMIWAAKDRYNNFFGGSRLVDNNCYYNNYSSLYTTLSNKMYNLSPKSSTTSMHIESVSKLYAKQRGVSVGHSSWLAPIANWGSVRDVVKKDIPVIVFGNYSGVGNHAVVAYDYYIAANGAYDYIICHMGYNNQSYAHYDGVIGSYYYIKN